MPGLNDVIEARMLRNGKWNGYTEMKAQWTGLVGLLATRANLPRFDRVHLSYVLYEPNMRRDPSNVVAGAMKFVEDGLKNAGVLPNDGWKNIASFQSQWFLDKEHPGVAVFLTFQQITAVDAYRLDRQSPR
jgi:hypothetical protein